MAPVLKDKGLIGKAGLLCCYKLHSKDQPDLWVVSGNGCKILDPGRKIPAPLSGRTYILSKRWESGCLAGFPADQAPRKP